MSLKIILHCSFSQIFCDFFRKSTKAKGQKLVGHVFDVTETRSNCETQIKTEINAKCIRQASVTKLPYMIEILLDDDRRITSAICSCIAGIQG